MLLLAPGPKTESLEDLEFVLTNKTQFDNDLNLNDPVKVVYNVRGKDRVAVEVSLANAQ
jgi:hypothetical protein